MALEVCPSCGVWRGHAAHCPTQPEVIARYGAADELSGAVNASVTFDDRKALCDVWTEHAPLPEQGLTEGTYDALMHVARWGARKALVNVALGMYSTDPNSLNSYIGEGKGRDLLS